MIRKRIGKAPLPTTEENSGFLEIFLGFGGGPKTKTKGEEGDEND